MVQNGGEPVDGTDAIQDDESGNIPMIDDPLPLDDGIAFQGMMGTGLQDEDDAWEDDPEDESISFAIRDFIDAQ